VSNNLRIPTPINVRWRRLQYQLVPFLTVILCSLIAWRLWHEAPRVTAVGQVGIETADVRSPSDGVLLDVPGRAPRLYDVVTTGQLLARLEHDGKTTDLTAPVTGQVVKLHRRAGDSVREGQLLVSIAGEHGRYITTYVRSDQRLQPEPGMPVDVRLKSDPSKTYRTAVERVGPQFEPVPAAQLRDRKAEEWGLPVIISIPPEAGLKPGELVYIGWYALGKAEPIANGGQSQTP
jgi:multidrug resistance efflux pump